MQALLQLDELETLRTRLQRISNACGKESLLLEHDAATAGDALMVAMGISELTATAILTAANQKRRVLGLGELAELKKEVPLQDGMDSAAPTAASKIPKIPARAEVVAATEAVKALTESSIGEEIAKAVDVIKTLQANEASLKDLDKEALLQKAVDLFDGHVCPVCETQFDPGHFRQVVAEQLLRLEAAAKARKAAEELLAPVVQRFEKVRDTLKPVIGYGPLFNPPIATEVLEECRRHLGEKIESIENFLPLSETLEVMNLEGIDSNSVLAKLAVIAQAVEAIPDPSDRDAARAYLILAEERLGTYRTAAAKARAGKRKVDISKRTFDVFGVSVNAALEGIYKNVEEDFKDLYRAINDDESAFDANLTPSIGKLGFDVNFYGRGSFPPGAYHSEGHQDAMGLCLYLALMRHILGDGFGIAVLDDVLMSVDTGHRRAVCSLLKAKFPNTQFVLTTHDPVWLRQMRSAGLITAKAGVEFHRWHVDTGPVEWKSIDVWKEIKDSLAKNNVREAASALRYHMELLSAEYCSELGGRVEYRPDNRYDLGMLLPGATAAMRDLLKKAKSAATSWGDTGLLITIEARETAFISAASAVLDKEWQYVNPAIHYNELEILSKEDFAPVAAAFEELSKQFACDKCGGTLFVSGTGLTKESLRCPCPAVNLTLLKKPSSGTPTPLQG